MNSLISWTYETVAIDTSNPYLFVEIDNANEIPFLASFLVFEHINSSIVFYLIEPVT